ncbi:DUF2179 domain-containing protein [Dethiosulfatibacter aminovorans]|nr:DUF5698 domain-containing protein [Dethiosulfatibacter aminovorans]
MNEILSSSSLLSYFLIFFAKIFEVSISTIRIMFVSRGDKMKASFIAFFEILLWIVVVSSVLKGLSEDPIKAIIYSAAFTIGNYIGITLEEKMAVGLTTIQAITKEGEGREAAQLLRDNNFGVTVIKGEGRECTREILLIHLKRKRTQEAVDLLNSQLDNAVISINAVKIIRGGYIRK